MELLNEMQALARQGGEMLRAAHDVAARQKTGDADLVTQYDVAVQEMLKAGLAALRPSARFVGEESGLDRSADEGERFIVDPIDGTANFVKGCRHSGISLALVRDGRPEYGVVYNPYLDEMFTARRGAGAFVNGRRMRCSQAELSRGIVFFGTSPYYPELRKKSMAALLRLIEGCQDLRRSGSAALDLCYVADGRADAFFEFLLSPWDYAAGVLMITEAGGTVTDLVGNAPRFSAPQAIVAGNARSAAQLRKFLASL